jgi:cobalamin transport system permease protein
MVIVLTALGVLLLLSGVVALATGTVSIPLEKIPGILTGSGPASDTERAILLDVRLPRLLLAICVGAGLSVAGLIFQALLRNPLAEPYILGISSGGTVGTLIALALSFGTLGTSLTSFAGSALVMFLVYAAAHRRGQMDTNTLLLAGVMIGAFFNAIVLLIIALMHQELRNAFVWLMGNLSNATTDAIELVGPVVAASIAILFWHAKSYNLIATGDESALQLGVRVKTVKRLSYVMGSLITGLVVSVSGVVGFVGLIIPHICRLLFGPDHRLLLPASLLLGATFMVLMDLISRTILAPAEIPVGAVTAAIGAPIFIYLLRKS